MTPEEKERLVDAVLTGDELGSFRQASLERGLGSLRQQRQRRRAVRALVLGSMPLILTAVFFWKSSPESSSSSVATRQALSTPARQRSSEVKILTDDQLLALFPGRAVALIGRPGRQQLVFLDEVYPSL